MEYPDKPTHISIATKMIEFGWWRKLRVRLRIASYIFRGKPWFCFYRDHNRCLREAWFIEIPKTRKSKDVEDF